MTVEHINTTATAALIRKVLKHAFPSAKFSVQSKRYAGGSSIDIFWTDGPTRAAVEAVAGPFAGASFDGMQDLKSYHRSWLHADGTAESVRCKDDEMLPPAGAKLVHFGADFVFCNRRLSDAFLHQFRMAWECMTEVERSKLMSKTNAWHAARHVSSWRLDATLSDFGSSAGDVFRVMANHVGV